MFTKDEAFKLHSYDVWFIFRLDLLCSPQTEKAINFI